MENIELKSAIDKKGNILENTDSSSVKSVYPIKKVCLFLLFKYNVKNFTLD